MILMGNLADKYGRRIVYLILSGFFLALIYVYLLYLDKGYCATESSCIMILIPPLSIYGINLGLFDGIIWACYPIIVNQN
jgi:hypothetical protein